MFFPPTIPGQTPRKPELIPWSAWGLDEEEGMEDGDRAESAEDVRGASVAEKDISHFYADSVPLRIRGDDNN